MSTAAVYRKLVSRLEAHAGAAVLDDEGQAVCTYLGRRLTADTLGWSTAKQYASAVRWTLREAGRGTRAFDRGWANLRPTVTRRTTLRRKSSRRTQVTQDVIEAVLAMAAVREEPSFRAAAGLFSAGVLLGLRPCEWAGARWEDASRRSLVVRNAKAASRLMQHGPFAGRMWQRANGEERVLVLTEAGIAGGIQAVVDTVIASERAYPWAQRRSTIWRAFKVMVRAAIIRGLISTKHRHLTIYSARHQFAADAKRSMAVGAGEVAAAMGHRAVRTAITGYGRRVVGRSNQPVARPTPQTQGAVKSLDLPRALGRGPQARLRADHKSPGPQP